MRLIQFILGGLFAVFAVVAGLITAAAIVMTGALILVVRRALRRGGPGGLQSREPRRVAGSGSGDVIDVTATEIPSKRGELQDQEAPFTARSSG